jgi:hypothetical protein
LTTHRQYGKIEGPAENRPIFCRYIMKIPTHYISVLEEFIQVSGGRNFQKIENLNQPDYKWFWGGSFFWAYTTEPFVTIYSNGNLKDFSDAFNSCIQEAEAELDEE